jgi:hypothetical protein
LLRHRRQIPMASFSRGFFLCLIFPSWRANLCARLMNGVGLFLMFSFELLRLCFLMIFIEQHLNIKEKKAFDRGVAMEKLAEH